MSVLNSQSRRRRVAPSQSAAASSKAVHPDALLGPDASLGLASAVSGQSPEQQAAALVEQERKRTATESAGIGGIQLGDALSIPGGPPGAGNADPLVTKQDMKRAAESFASRNREVVDAFMARKMANANAAAAVASSAAEPRHYMDFLKDQYVPTVNASAGHELEPDQFVNDPNQLLTDVQAQPVSVGKVVLVPVAVPATSTPAVAPVVQVACVEHPRLSQYLDPQSQKDQWVVFNIGHQMQRPVKEEAMIRLMGVFDAEQSLTFVQTVGKSCGNYNYWRTIHRRKERRRQHTISDTATLTLEQNRLRRRKTRARSPEG